MAFSFDGVMWELRGPEQLGIAEQTLLLVLLEVAAEQLARTNASDEWTSDIESGLYAPGESRRPRTARLTVSFYELCHRLGRNAGGSAINQRRAELKRLCEVTVWARHSDKTVFQSRLLGWEVGNDRGVTVLLNWRLTKVLFGGQFSPVCLSERLSLSSECARALHCALSLRIRPGKTMAFHLDKLAPSIWADAGTRPKRTRRGAQAPAESPAAVAVRRRRPELLDGISEMARLRTWTVKETVNGAFRFTRHALVKQEELIIPEQRVVRRTTQKLTSGDRASEIAKEGTREIWQMFSGKPPPS